MTSWTQPPRLGKSNKDFKSLKPTVIMLKATYRGKRGLNGAKHQNRSANSRKSSRLQHRVALEKHLFISQRSQITIERINRRLGFRLSSQERSNLSF